MCLWRSREEGTAGDVREGAIGRRGGGRLFRAFLGREVESFYVMEEGKGSHQMTAQNCECGDPLKSFGRRLLAVGWTARAPCLGAQAGGKRQTRSGAPTIRGAVPSPQTGDGLWLWLCPKPAVVLGWRTPLSPQGRRAGSPLASGQAGCLGLPRRDRPCSWHRPALWSGLVNRGSPCLSFYICGVYTGLRSWGVRWKSECRAPWFAAGPVCL